MVASSRDDAGSVDLPQELNGQRLVGRRCAGEEPGDRRDGAGIGDLRQPRLGVGAPRSALELGRPLSKQRLPVPVSVLLGQSLVLFRGDLLVVHPAAVVLDVAEVVPRRRHRAGSDRPRW